MPEQLIDISQLPAIILQEARSQPQRATRALRRAARISEALVVDASDQYEDRGTFRQAWTVEDTEDGAILGNDAPHAEIVEEGTRPFWPRFYPVFAYMYRRLSGGAGVPPGVTPHSQRYDLGDQPPFQKSHQAYDPQLDAIRQAALQVARSIASRGIRPHRILAAAQGDINNIVREELQREFPPTAGGTQ